MVQFPSTSLVSSIELEFGNAKTDDSYSSRVVARHPSGSGPVVLVPILSFVPLTDLPMK